jgi:methylated-DNA-[protein]-cysteine S-methyltransferase
MSLPPPDPPADLKRMLWRSPFGPLGLVLRGEKLAAVTLNADPAVFPFEVERTYGTSGRESATSFTDVRRELEEYFDGKRLVFRLPLDLNQGSPFQRRVWRALRDIPYGETVSYKEVAHAIGQPSATRAVGAANGMNPLPIVIPCHRVVASDGTLGGYGGGLDLKRRLLALESATRARAARLGGLGDADGASPPRS